MNIIGHHPPDDVRYGLGMVSQAKNLSPPPRDGRVIRGRQLKLKAVTEVDETGCTDLQHGAFHRVILETQGHRVIGAVADALALGVLFGEIIGDQTRRVVRRRAGREIAGEDPIAGLDDRQQEIDLRDGLVGGREIVADPGEEVALRVVRLGENGKPVLLEERARDMIHAPHETTPSVWTSFHRDESSSGEVLTLFFTH